MAIENVNRFSCLSKRRLIGEREVIIQNIILLYHEGNFKNRREQKKLYKDKRTVEFILESKYNFFF